MFALVLSIAALSPFAVVAQSTPGPSPSPVTAPAAPDSAASDAAKAAALQAAAANPIASMVSVPFQYNLNFNYGPYRQTQQVLNVQPVIPTDLGGGHTLISRIVTPLVALPALGPGVGPQVGLGDLNPQFFYVPKQGAVMLGYGPALLLPTGTSQWVGSGKWGIGPTAVVVVSGKGVVYGVLANNIWSVAGDPSRAAVNQALYQLFSSWTLQRGWSVGVTTTTTVNWNAAGSNKWNVPLGPTFSKLVRSGDTTSQIGGAFFWNTVRPAGGATWTARMVWTLLYPTK
jgi:hypothetical protein